MLISVRAFYFLAQEKERMRNFHKIHFEIYAYTVLQTVQSPCVSTPNKSKAKEICCWRESIAFGTQEWGWLICIPVISLTGQFNILIIFTPIICSPAPRTPCGLPRPMRSVGSRGADNHAQSPCPLSGLEHLPPLVLCAWFQIRVYVLNRVSDLWWLCSRAACWKLQWSLRILISGPENKNLSNGKMIMVVTGMIRGQLFCVKLNIDAVIPYQ